MAMFFYYVEAQVKQKEGIHVKSVILDESGKSPNKHKI